LEFSVSTSSSRVSQSRTSARHQPIAGWTPFARNGSLSSAQVVSGFLIQSDSAHHDGRIDVNPGQERTLTDEEREENQEGQCGQ
jgi:hypothetical protein